MDRDQQLTAALKLLGLQRHSFANHLQVISGYVQLNKFDRINDYLKNVIAEIMAEGMMHKMLTVTDYLWIRNELEELKMAGVRVTLKFSLVSEELQKVPMLSLREAWCIVKEEVLLLDPSHRELRLELIEIANGVLLDFFWPGNNDEQGKEKTQYYTTTDGGNLKLRTKLLR